MSESAVSPTRDIAPGASLLERFAHQASETPDTLAVQTHDAALSYAELAQRIETIAAGLTRHGLKPGQRVAFSVQRDERMLAFLLGILRAGGTYIPFDARLPKARLETMLDDIRPEFSLVDASFGEGIEAPGRIDPDALWQESEPGESEHDLPPVSGGESIAYILFTSGSTGRPKGALISHRALDAYLVALQKSLTLAPGDVTLAGTTLSFDISVSELFLPLVTGGTILLSSAVDEPSEICTLCANHSVRLMWTTPSKWRALLRAGLRPAPQMIAVTGGEALPQDLAAQLLPLVDSLWNSYGPTETTVAATIERISAETSPITIGRAMPGMQLTIVDESLNALPDGETGEILIGGPTVGSGYWEREELTSQVFLHDPASAPHPTHYRSGDLGQRLADGRILFLGRKDRQVKVRGHRVELGEIEAAALTHPDVSQAVADLRERRAGDARLILYYATASGEALSPSALRKHLGEHVPGHSIPQHSVFIEEFPIAPSGKVNVAALPDPTTQREAASEWVAPRTPFEKRLQQLFSEELGQHPVSIRDSFFDLGGHSIMAAAIFAQMHSDTGIDLPLARLVEAPTIEGLAAIFEEHAETQSREPDWSGLVRFKERDSHRAVFFIHAAGGNVLNYAPIAAQIDDASVYGIQARGLDGLTAPADTFPEIADNYTKLIREELEARELRSAVLCGGSFGGCAAVEVARRLEADGFDIPLVILLDSIGPGTADAFVDREPTQLPSLKGISARLNTLGRSLAAACYRGLGIPLPNPLRYNYLTDRHSKVLRKFRLTPEAREPYAGPVLLLRGPLTPQAGNALYSAPELGWEGILVGDVKRSYIDATHDVFVENRDTVRAVRDALVALDAPSGSSGNTDLS